MNVRTALLERFQMLVGMHVFPVLMERYQIPMVMTVKLALVYKFLIWLGIHVLTVLMEKS